MMKLANDLKSVEILSDWGARSMLAESLLPTSEIPCSNPAFSIFNKDHLFTVAARRK